MKSLSIAIDVDDVLFPCMEWGVELCRERYGVELDFNKLSWDFSELPPTQSKAITDLMETGDIYDFQRPYEGAQNFVKTLFDEGHDVIFLTSPEPRWQNTRTAQILKFFSNTSIRNIILTPRKDLVRTHVLIDDNPKYLSTSPAETVIAMDRPWNQDIPYRIHRVHDYDEAYEIIHRIAVQQTW